MQKNKTNIQDYNDIISFLSDPKNMYFDYMDYNKKEKTYCFINFETKLVVKSKLHDDNSFTIFAKSPFLKKIGITNIDDLCSFIAYNGIVSSNEYFLN